jgi:hypothetical protein
MLNTPEAIKQYAYGCDADVGGTSTFHFDFDLTTTLPACLQAPLALALALVIMTAAAELTFTASCVSLWAPAANNVSAAATPVFTTRSGADMFFFFHLLPFVLTNQLLTRDPPN